MKAVLIYPPYKREEIFSKLARNAPVLPPLGLAYLATAIMKKGWKVVIIDCPALEWDINDVISYLENMEDIDFIGITANSPLISRVLSLTKMIKHSIGNIPIILGGYHPTFLPYEVLEEESVDSIVQGEGELTIGEFCDYLNGKMALEEIKGLGYKENGTIKLNEPREFIGNLDSLGFPAYHLLPMNRYKTSSGFEKTNNQISIMGSRGCTANCYFCTSPHFWKRQFRAHSPEYLIKLMNYLYEKFGKNYFQFRDDTITIDQSWLIQLCNLMKNNKYVFKWDCYARFDHLNETILKAMKDAGCIEVSLGVECADENTLLRVKGLTKKCIFDAISLLKKYGFRTRFFFMIGPPAKNKEDVDETIKFAKDLNPDLIVITASIPYPGSSFYNSMLERGMAPDFRLQIPDVYSGFCDFDNFSKVYLTRKIKHAYRSFYFRPGYLIQQTLKLRSVRDLKEAFKGFLSLLWLKS